MTINYSRMQDEWPKQKRALNRALKKTNPHERRKAVEKVCIEAVTVWDEVGAWPDDWAMFQRALDDSRHWNDWISLEELVRRDRWEQGAASLRVLQEAQADAQREHDEEYPEHAKLKALEGERLARQAAAEWLAVNECNYEEGDPLAEFAARLGDDVTYEAGLAEFAGHVARALVGKRFGIDPDALEAERRHMAATLRGGTA